MKRLVALVVAGALALGVVGVAAAHGNSGKGNGGFNVGLSGYDEVPSISSTGTGSLALTVNSAGTQIAYTLTYSGLQGGSALAAHIHLGQSGVSGGVAAFLCGGGGKPSCPAAGGTVTGTIVPADVQAIATQGLGAGDLAALLRAMSHGVTYVNVHSTSFPSGEIRGQIGGHGGGGGHGGDNNGSND